MTLNIFTVAVAALCCAAVVSQSASAQPAAPDNKPAIVLVHGAYADGTSWSKVISLLQARGYPVVSVQNPTTSLADDVTSTERVLSQQKGPVVLVGHSWAGVVITQAGNHPNVKALVYVDASAPDSGQSILDAAAALPAAPGASAGVKDQYGFLTLPEAAVRQYFAQDLSYADQGIIFATQTPWGIGCLTDKVTHAAWHDKPSWWVIGENDRMINPKLQEKMAAQIKAKVTKLPTSHLAMLVDPKAVTAVILEAADKVQPGKFGGVLAPASSAAADHTGYAPIVAAPVESQAPAPRTVSLTAQEVRGPAAIVPLSSEAPVKLIVDSPLADSLVHGRVVIPYRAENLRIVPVFGAAALKVSPRIGHIHVTVDDAPWHWLDASGEPLVITGLTAGKHKILIELVNASHQTLDYEVVNVDIPKRSLTPNDPKAEGFRKLPDSNIAQ
jgi:pimeloyl-ACP methyl ester carboxylesterase